MLTVADIMTRQVLTIRSSATVVQAIALMQAKQVRSLVVEREAAGGAYGVITERDIVYGVTAKSGDPKRIRVGEIMKSPCIVVTPNVSLPELARKLSDADIQRMPVVEDNQLLGIVSVTDIIMKSNIDAVHLPADLSEQVELALRHRRLGWNTDRQQAQESKVALKVLEELT